MIFFGTSTFSIHVLERLKSFGIVPDVIVTVPDKPAGRKLVMTAPPVKTWALENNIKCLQFQKLDNRAVELLKIAESEKFDPASDAIDSIEEISQRPDIFIVASYGKIIPKEVLDIPLYGCLNVHPSILPKLRGATPLQTSILLDMKKTGVTIIKMDEKMDHGPIVTSWISEIDPWPMNILDLEKLLAEKGGDLLNQILKKYIQGKIELIEQDHQEATFTKKIEKEDGLIHIEMSKVNDIGEVFSGKEAYEIYLKYQALCKWPGLYFFIDKSNSNNDEIKIRVKIKDVDYDQNQMILKITKVIPEGKKEMSWKDFLNFIK